MDKDLIQKLKRSPRVHVVENPNDGCVTVYLDRRLVVQVTQTGTLTAFQADSKLAERIANAVLDPSKYKVIDNHIVIYEDGLPMTSFTPMEVLLKWKKENLR